MPRHPRQPIQLRGRIFAARYALSRNLLTPAELRSSAWRQLFRGVYADRTLHISHLLRIRAAAKHLLPAETVIAGRSAACLHGVDIIPDEEDVEVITPSQWGPVRGIRPHTGLVEPADVVVNPLGLLVTTPLRTAWDLACWLDTVEAVVIIDILLAKRAFSVDELRTYALGRVGIRGWRRAAKVASLADGDGDAPQGHADTG